MNTHMVISRDYRPLIKETKWTCNVKELCVMTHLLTFSHWNL